MTILVLLITIRLTVANEFYHYSLGFPFISLYIDKETISHNELLNIKLMNLSAIFSFSNGFWAIDTLVLMDLITCLWPISVFGIGSISKAPS
jgi:hypothetical protein